MKLVPIESIRPSTYNPREGDEIRYKYLEISLRKLGFLLPMYADATSEMLSGHQRQLIAQNLGFNTIPVEITKPFELNERKAINIAFNRGTNDLKNFDTSKGVLAIIEKSNIDKLIDQVPDIDMTNEKEMFPCMFPEFVNIKKIIVQNYHLKNDHAVAVNRSLYNRGILMPIVIDENDNLVNGIGRLFIAAEKKEKTIAAIRLIGIKAELAKLLLNYLTMDFTIEKRYADFLRHNSFRRGITFRAGLGKGFFRGNFVDTSREFNLSDPGTLKKWKGIYGKTVLDFGAGRLTDTVILKDAGIKCIPFEPYFMSGEQINIEGSRKLTIEFLNQVASGIAFDSIFISSVFNSVPFKEDRQKILTLCAALSNAKTKTRIWTLSRKANQYNMAFTKSYNEKEVNSAQRFSLDYEEGIVIGELARKPKVQKYHSAKELYDICKLNFKEIQFKEIADMIYMVCSKPLFSKDELIKAIEFEFNLPYPNDQRMNLVNEAKQAFSKRLNIEL